MRCGEKLHKNPSQSLAGISLSLKTSKITGQNKRHFVCFARFFLSRSPEVYQFGYGCYA